MRLPVAVIVAFLALGCAVPTASFYAASVYTAKPKAFPGNQRLFDEAQRVSGRKCTPDAIDDLLAKEDGEAGRLCAPPEIVHMDLSKVEAYGVYDHTTNPRVVFVDPKAAKPGSKKYEETIVHEYVHYLQWVQGDLKPRGDPCERAALEVEAHKADQEFSHPGHITEETKQVMFHHEINCMLWQSSGARR